MKNWSETKEERRERKARERPGPPTVLTPNPKIETTSNPKNYVVCLKWGTKYSAEYVNKLYNMVKRNLTINYEFVCFTEDKKGIDPTIRVEPLPSLSVSGWWYKPWFFKQRIAYKGHTTIFRP
jgi:hypothetical protein